MSSCDAPGCVLLLIDESAGMNVLMGETVSDGSATSKTNLERVATAINSFLNGITTGNDFDIALVGYQADAAGQPQIGSRWDGPLAGREWVSVRELAAAPLRVETRTRKIPAPNGLGVAREEAVSFPVWYSPTAGAKAPQIAAYSSCLDRLSQWQLNNGSAAAPLVIHISAGASADGNPTMVVRKLLELGKNIERVPIVFQAHLATNATLTPALFASNVMLLTSPSARDLFQRTSPLPDALVQQLKKQKVVVNSGARAMIHNAKIGDLIRFLGLVRQHVQSWPSRTAPTPAAEETLLPTALASPISKSAETGEMPVAAATEFSESIANDLITESKVSPALLLVIVLDRSVEDPYSGDTKNVCAKLQDTANEILKQVARMPADTLEVAIVSYGVDSTAVADIRSTFDGPLASRSVVRREELIDGAIRVEEYDEELSNGVGGLIKIKRKKTIFFDLEPSATGGAAEGFEAVANISNQWRGNQSNEATTIILHLTRGTSGLEAIESAFRTISSANGALYHLVVTEQPHDSVAYPENDHHLMTDELKHMWNCSTRLLALEHLVQSHPNLGSDARGMVINGKFDVLSGMLEAICGGAKQ